MLLQIQSEFERMGDYAINIQECAERLYSSGSSFSASALEEIKTLSDAVSECITKAIHAFTEQDISIANSIEPAGRGCRHRGRDSQGTPHRAPERR